MNDIKKTEPALIVERELLLMETNEALTLKLKSANLELANLRVEQDRRSIEREAAIAELIFQNQEKEERAAELVIANKELAYQNSEKEQRAAELIIANKELFFQNTEKGKRAAELITANAELKFQNQEKQRKAEELSAAYLELRKTEVYLKNYIQGLEEMIFMTSHKVRQPIANILGISDLLNESKDLPDELKKLLDYIKQSALTLDVFTQELTVFMNNLNNNSDRSRKG